MTALDDARGPWCPEGARARFGRRAFAHPTVPDALVWLPGGRGLVTFAGWAVWRWSDDGALRAVWWLPDDDEAPRGSPLGALLSVSDDGGTAAVPFDDGALLVCGGGAWSAGRVPARASCLAVTPSGRALVFGTQRGDLVVTDHLGRPRRRARVTREAVSRIVPRDDDAVFVCASGSVSCVRLDDLSVVWREAGGARALAVSPARDRVVVDSPRAMQAGREDELHTTVTRDGAVTFDAAGPVRVLDALTGRRCAEVLPASRPTRFVAFADAQPLVGVSDRELVRARLDRDARFQGTPWRYPGFVAAACASPDGAVIASLHTTSPFVHRWDAHTAQPLDGARASPGRLTATTDGRFFTDDGRVFDAVHGEATWRAADDAGERPRAVVSHDGQRAAVVRPGRGLEVVAVNASAPPRHVTLRGTVLAVAWARDGRSLAVWSQVNTSTDSTELRWDIDLLTDASTPHPVDPRDAWAGGFLACGARGEVYAAARGATGLAWRPVALAWWDGEAWATDARDGVLPGVARVRDGGRGDFALAATPEGALVLRAVATGEAVVSVESDLDASVAYHHGRGLLALGAFHGDITLWHVPTGRRRATVRHGFGVEGLVFSADGDTLASADRDGTLMLWDVDALSARGG